MINDVEDLLRDVQSYVKSNLNTKITAINDDHSDFTTETITADDDHYVFGGELAELPNHAFVNFIISSPELTVNVNHDDRIVEPSILIEVAFDNPKKQNTYFKSLRYMEALFQTILGYEASTTEVDDLQITKAVPMMVTSNRRQLVVSGIEISLAIS